VQKPEVVERNGFGGKVTCPSSIHRYMGESDRTSGLDGTSTSLSFCLFSVRTTVARAYRPQFLRYRDENMQADCPIGGMRFEKNFGGRTP